jgi:hypothetical protein
MMRLRLAGLFAAALAIVPFTTSASDQDDALRLAKRVASQSGFVDATVTLHAAPKDFPASIPLPQAALLGSIVQTVRPGISGRGGGRTAGATVTTTTTVGTTTALVAQPVTFYYDAPSGRDAVVAAYDAALARAGWKAVPDIMSRMQMPQGGFTLPFPAIKSWCSPGERTTALNLINAADATGFDLSVASSDHRASFQCGDGPSPFDAFRERSPLPTFTAPSGVKITAGGPATDGTTTAARLESNLGIRTVFEAFAKQLSDAGWTGSASMGTDTARTQTFKKTIDGTPYVTLLAVYALDATHYVALADVSDVK